MRHWRFFVLIVLCILASLPAESIAQSVASGTVNGVVADPSGAVIPGAMVVIRNVLSSYERTTSSDPMGAFRFSNLPFTNYHLEITQAGFAASQQDVAVRTTVPIELRAVMAIAGTQQTVNVEAAGSDILETVPFAHNDVGLAALDKLPTLSPASGLSDAIVMSTPGVASDSNGFFHPLGDHAQTSFAIDGQPISDQQSKAFSTQVPVNAIQSMEIISGSPAAEFGDKTSLVVNATTRSGLGQSAPTGSFSTEYGSFGTISGDATLGVGTKKLGYFLATNGTRSGRFLDTPEFSPIHAVGNSSNAFNRLDWDPTNADAFHLNVLLARNWFQIPNSYDQPNQDQRQKVVTFNIAPGYQHTINRNTLLTLNPFVRQDRVSFYPSGDPLNDFPATLGQQRRLTNYGIRGDISFAGHGHNLKLGGQIMQTRLREDFRLGITDPTLAAAEPALLPYDLTQGGSPFQFAATGRVDEYSTYIQDSFSAGGFTLNPGVRLDHYAFGSTTDTAVQPRLGVSYLVKDLGLVLRTGYARTMETPYNENLLLSSAAGASGITDVFGAQGAQPLLPGRRNQYNVGFQQAVGHYLQIDGEYFWKFTDNAFDFDVLFNTPVSFPISWKKSKLDGASIRVSTPEIRGFQASTTMGHARARFFGPEVGGLLFNSPVDAPVFRIDHDQAFQQNTGVRYQWHRNGPWANFTWRYDSGQVAGAVGDLNALLGLSSAEQAAVGFFCSSATAAVSQPITACSASDFGATRLKLPPPGLENDDSNPPRIAPRHVFDLGVGTDNLFKHSEGARVEVRFGISNLTNKSALYNFQSTFSGTHFVEPRSYSGRIGFEF